jgi:hypothetical protein
LLAACGSSSSSTSSSSASPAAGSGGGTGAVVFTGAVTGTWQKAGAAADSTCGAQEVVIHIKGPAAKDEADLHVKADGSVWLDAPNNGGDYTSTSGGTMHANSGFDVNADLKEPRGAAVHAAGSLSC